MAYFVGRVVAVSSAESLGKPVASAGFEENIESIVIALDSGQSCTLDPSVREAPGHVRMLRMLSHAAMPVYLEMDAARKTISRLLIPGVYQVQNIAQQPVDDRLDVDLLVSQSRNYVATTNPDFQRIVEVLRTARQQGATVLVTRESDRPEIIDVRLTDIAGRAGNIDLPAADIENVPSVAVPVAVTGAQAQHAFDLVAAQDCSTVSSSISCIPFRYPDQGCWARAHEMCRILIANDFTPTKIWSYGSRKVETRNHPTCSVSWTWHMAPCIGSAPEEFVIDPSLFSRPVTVGQWLDRQPVLPPSLPDDFEFTDASVYLTERLDRGGALRLDPYYVNTNADLTAHRFWFVQRCTVSDPPGPPYDCP